jgi:hypothetical protein
MEVTQCWKGVDGEVTRLWQGVQESSKRSLPIVHGLMDLAGR